MVTPDSRGYPLREVKNGRRRDEQRVADFPAKQNAIGAPCDRVFIGPFVSQIRRLVASDGMDDKVIERGDRIGLGPEPDSPLRKPAVAMIGETSIIQPSLDVIAFCSDA